MPICPCSHIIQRKMSKTPTANSFSNLLCKHSMLHYRSYQNFRTITLILPNRGFDDVICNHNNFYEKSLWQWTYEDECYWLFEQRPKVWYWFSCASIKTSQTTLLHLQTAQKSLFWEFFSIRMPFRYEKWSCLVIIWSTSEYKAWYLCQCDVMKFRQSQFSYI